MKNLIFVGVIYNSASYCGWLIKPVKNQIYNVKEIYKMLYGFDPVNNKEQYLYDSSLKNDKDWIKL